VEQDWIVVFEGPAPANWVPVDNVWFIAAARNALPELIKDLREARANLKREAFERNDADSAHAAEYQRRIRAEFNLREARAELARLRRQAERPPTSTANPGSAEAIRFAVQCRRDFGAAPALAPDAQPDDAVLP
jgi:hypothetical protein